MKKIAYLLLFITVKLWSQDQHEPQDWKKLNSNYANIIFPSGQEKEAEKIANIIAYIQKHNHKSMGYTYQAIDIILRSNTAESNGFVTYSPFRSEFYNTTPPTYNNLGTTDWLTTLSIHEYRHVQQFLNHKEGNATNTLYWLMGETGWALGSIINVPNWYFEGDAVVMETALTKSGRGRLPNFTALQRALAIDNKTYSYQKTRNGSYKDLVPNHYATGYQMLNYYRNNFDAAWLDNIAQKSAGSIFYSFSRNMKKETGLSTTRLYKKSNQENAKIWKQYRDSLQVKSYTTITKDHKKAVQYHYPQVLENGNLIALKSSLDEIETFYEIDTHGNETKITPAVIGVDDYFDYKSNKITYTGISYNTRYINTSYNDVYIYNMNTKLRKKITHKKRYFSPSFNKKTDKIIVVESTNSTSNLVILNAFNGAKEYKIKFKSIVTRPQFIDNNNYAYIKQFNHQVAIFKINKNSLKETQLTPWTSHSVDNIRLFKDKLYYSASFNGIDNIYESPLDGSLQVNQITNASIGAYQPFVAKNKVYFTEQTSIGGKISSTEISPTAFSFVEPVLMDWNNNKTVQFEGGNILDQIENKSYQVSKYHSPFEDLKFHDWRFGLTEELFEANITATSLLNDFSWTSGISIYNNENNSYGFSTIASYKKWLPVLNLGFDYTHRDFKTTLPDKNNILYNGDLVYDETTISPSITIPLSQIRGNYSNNFFLNIGYEFYKSNDPIFKLDNSNQEPKLAGRKYNLVNNQLHFSSKRKKALQNINTTAGLSLSIESNKIISDNIQEAKNKLEGKKFFNTNNYLYLPGFSKTHNSFVNLAYQKNEFQNTDTFVYARGYQNLLAKKVSKLSYTYQLPLLYPDFGILGITYFKRIRANVFGDFSRLTLFDENSTKTKQQSVGLEIIFDNTVFNIGQAKIGLGYRGSYLLKKDILAPNSNKWQNGFFFTTNFF